MDYVGICKQTVESIRKLGADEAEALILSTRSIGVEIERAEVKTCSDAKDVGIAIRAITEGKTGFSYTNNLAPKEVEKAAAQATRASKASLKDKNWRRLPVSKTYPIINDGFDKRFENFSPDEAVALCLRMMEVAVQFDNKVMPAFGGTEVAVNELACANSQGLEAHDKGTTMFWGLGTIARSGTQVSPMCFEFKASRMYNPEPDWVAKEAARLAIEAVNIGKAEAGKFPVLLDSFALQSLLTYTLIPSVKGDIVYQGRSILKDKVGEQIAGDNITLFDDGTLYGGLYSGKTDLEGVPRQRTPLISDGILKGFLYDNYWARVEERESTGNARRGGGGLNLPPYGTLPTINPSNVVLESGSASEQELFEEIGSGYYVRDVQGAHQSNPETGEFSVALTPAWRIQDGEIAHAVKGAMMSGNIYELIKKISLLGKETRQVGMLVAPKTVVSELQILSK